MTPTEPKVESNGRYSVSQVCEILKCHRNSLLNWTNDGRIKCSFNKKHKFYFGRDILKFWQETL